MISARNGTYANYDGKEYFFARVYKSYDDVEKMKKYKNKYSDMCIIPKSVELVSHDRGDLLHGFTIYRDNAEGFSCIKIVQSDNIKNVYIYNSYAVYKNNTCKVSGPSDDGNFFLETKDWLNITMDTDLLQKDKEYGFEPYDCIGHGFFTFGKYVSPDDPELQIFEERTEIDVNSL